MYKPYNYRNRREFLYGPCPNVCWKPLITTEKETEILRKLKRTWFGIKDRCKNPKSPHYRHYGGRGIKLCPEWEDFEVFVLSVGYPCGYGLSIDRIDNDGDYEPANVRWATESEQGRNKYTHVYWEETYKIARKMGYSKEFAVEAAQEAVIQESIRRGSKRPPPLRKLPLD